MKVVRMGDFMVHFELDNWIRFHVYPVVDWEKIGGDEKGIYYMDIGDSCEWVDGFVEGQRLKKFEGSFCWRGVWEGRLYFTDDEYWGEDIEELSRLYNDKIIPWCKAKIIEDDPSHKYDD